MKGVDLKMILITILAFILILLIAITVGAIVIGGAGFIVIFSDVIVCAAIIGWIIYKLVRKQKGWGARTEPLPFYAKISRRIMENQ